MQVTFDESIVLQRAAACTDNPNGLTPARGAARTGHGAVLRLNQWGQFVQEQRYNICSLSTQSLRSLPLFWSGLFGHRTADSALHHSPHVSVGNGGSCCHHFSMMLTSAIGATMYLIKLDVEH